MVRLFGLVLCALAVAAAPSRAGLLVFNATLDGPSEAPPNASPATGFATITFNTDLHTMRVEATFSGLLGTTTAAHIHAATLLPGTGTAGVATETPSFTGFPLGVTAGTYDHTFDMTLPGSYRAAFITANGGTPASAEAALVLAAVEGKAYLNIHTNLFPGGEIRGFLVPEPTSLALMGLGALGLAGAARRRARRTAAG